MTTAETVNTARTPLPYMPQLNGLRAFAVIGVLVNHYFHTTSRYVELGVFGVSLFFVLSGFLITGILLRARHGFESRHTSLGHAMRSFYIRRFLRIFPLFYFVVLGAAAANIPRARDLLPWNLTYLTNIWMLVHSEWAGVFSHFWSLAVEEQFYLLWPCVILLAPRRMLPGLIAAMIAVGPLTKIVGTLAGASPIFIRVLPFSCLDMLGTGALLAIASDSSFVTRVQPHQIARAGWLLGLPVFAAGAVLRQFREPHDLLLNTANDAGIALLSVALVAGAVRGFSGAGGRLLQWKPLVAIGTISYGVYVYHLFVAGVMSRLAGLGIPHIPEPWRFILFFIATAGISAVSWLAMERPLNNLKRHFEYADDHAPAKPRTASTM